MNMLERNAKISNNPRLLFVTVFGLLLLTGCGPGEPPAWIEGRYDVGGYSLYMRCARPQQFRPETPTIVLEHGIGGKVKSTTWKRVVGEVAVFAPVYRYDRAGIGKSDPPPAQGRTGHDLTRETHALLSAAKVPGPYVLVGHSFGGFPVRLFAHAYPDEVVGLILVDTPHEEMVHTDAVMMTPVEPEFLDVARIEQEVGDGGRFGDLPIVVVKRELDSTPRWDAFQQRHLDLSDNTKLVVAEDSGHEVPSENPKSVADAIRGVLEAVGSGR